MKKEILTYEQFFEELRSMCVLLHVSHTVTVFFNLVSDGDVLLDVTFFTEASKVICTVREMRFSSVAEAYTVYCQLYEITEG